MCGQTTLFSTTRHQAMRRALVSCLYQHCKSICGNMRHPYVSQLSKPPITTASATHTPLYTPLQRTLVPCILPQPIQTRHVASCRSIHSIPRTFPHPSRLVSTHITAATPAQDTPPAAQLQPSDVQVILDVSIEGKQQAVSRYVPHMHGVCVCLPTMLMLCMDDACPCSSTIQHTHHHTQHHHTQLRNELDSLAKQLQQDCVAITQHAVHGVWLEQVALAQEDGQPPPPLPRMSCVCVLCVYVVFV